MKALLLHLSDIHISSSNHPVLKKAPFIVDAVKNVASSCDVAVCVISGDLAFSGLESEYLEALTFLDSIREKISDSTGAKMHLVLVPGNHDCDFSAALGVRSTVLHEVESMPSKMLEASRLEICLSVMRQFFFLQDAIQFPPVDRKASASGLVDIVSIPVGEELLRFFLLNTAATSRLPETPGIMVFPSESIPSPDKSATVAVAVFHHPPQWLEPNCGRLFRNAIAKSSDIVLTGHEHVQDAVHVSSARGESTYVEGGALYDPNFPNESAFNVILLDTQDDRKRLTHYVWANDRYEPIDGADPSQSNLWEDFKQNSVRKRDDFTLLPNFATLLDDPGMDLNHRTKGELKLDDVYVYPDLVRFHRPGEKSKETVSGDRIGDLIQNHPSLFIVGDYECGKTAMAKRLFRLLRERGDIPILIDASKQKLTIRECTENIADAFLKNYERSSLEAFRQCEFSRRVVIIDNYHLAKIAPRDRYLFIERLRRESFRIILFAHEAAVTLQDLTESLAGDGDSPFVYYSILPFGYRRQDVLIQKWLMLDEEMASETAPFIESLERLRRMIEAVVGRNYVPAYPPYLLAILQADESGMPLDLRANTHGHFYELFIKQSIARHSGSSTSVHILMTFLSHFANWLFSKRVREIPESEIRARHKDLQQRREVFPEFSTLMGQLERMQMLSIRNDMYRFRQPYAYYYFLSLYFSTRLNDPEVQQAINTLVQELYREESASTLLFLSHHSKDSRILDTLIAACDAQYESAPEATLDTDVAFLNDLGTGVQRITLPQLSVTQMREQELARLDAVQREEIDYEEAHRAELEAANTLLGRVNSALKTLQILGQFLKNFPADLEIAEKDRIIVAMSGLARRTLGNYLKQLSENEDAFLREFVQIIAQRHPSVGLEKQKVHAAAALATYGELASLGLVHRLAIAMGSNLLMPTYDRFFQSSNVPFMRLTFLALKLDHVTVFPESLVEEELPFENKNPLRFRLARHIVTRHMFTFQVPYQLKQKLAKWLHLDYQKLQQPNPARRLIS